MELSKTFDAKAAEEHWFQLWIDRGYFRAAPSRPGPAFSIVIPPPNVTGALHLGHALNNTLQDVIVRTRRMQGYNTLWVPGTDHAGIATQNVVEREIAKEGKTRHDLGREKFVERVWQWRETYGGKILHQLRRLGCSCDWSRERFTLDEGLSRAVTKVFVQLYNEGLIERDYRLINWCPRCETALSDLEVDHKEIDGNLWYIRYPLLDCSGTITVATTRPETMLGDTAVAINPEDSRFKDLAGRILKLPLVGREIPIIADAAVDPQFGTGAVKITPGHDFNDFEIGHRHHLSQISVMDTRARMNAEAGPYAGMTREDCRKRILADLTTEQLLDKTEPHKHALGVCSRCDTIVEPMLSYQWFMRVSKLDASGQSIAGRAIAAVEQGDTRFFPQHWENTYFAWMRNIQDWCISRQLWWGHRIPAYWCQRCTDPRPIVAETRPSSCPNCGGSDLRQDDDVLDTWFSSGLWPFTTLGWPERTADLERYYPTSLLITAFDIIFFWVARMMMFGLKINPLQARSPSGAVPFRHVYITPLVRDAQGKKMTKSRGNVIDPLDIMEKYGTDAVRFTLAQLAVQGRDLVLSDERLAASRAFANKIWNAARFVLMNLEGTSQPLEQVEVSSMSLADRWILSRLDVAIRDVSSAIDAYEFNVAALAVYQFIWHEFCDWYIELSKEALKSNGRAQAAARYVLVHCLDQLLRLLHPFMPFISEEIWRALRPYLNLPNLSEHLAVSGWPQQCGQELLNEELAEAMLRCKQATQAINSLRSLLGLSPGERVNVFIKAPPPLSLEIKIEPTGQISSQRVKLNEEDLQSTSTKTTERIKDDLDLWEGYACTLAKTSKITLLRPNDPRPPRTAVRFLKWCQIFVEAPSTFDFEKQREKLRRQQMQEQVQLQRDRARLENPQFMSKAPEEEKLKISLRQEQSIVRIAALQSEIISLPEAER